MSVHREHKNGRDVAIVRWRDGGRQRSRQFDREDDAQTFQARLRRISQTGEPSVLAGEITLAEYAAEWWERYAEPRLDPRVLVSYGYQLDLRIKPRLGGTPLNRIRPKTVEDFSASLAAAGVGDPTILRTLAVLQAIMKRAVIDGLIATNPVREITKPPQTREREPILIPVEAVEKMRAYLRAKDDLRSAALVCLLGYSGPRPESEGIQLRWGRIRKNSILYTATKRRGRHERSTRLLAPLAADLEDWRAVCKRTGPGNLVFPTPDGDEWREHDWRNWRRRTFLPAAKHAGLPVKTEENDLPPGEQVRPRDLRSSFATLLVYEGQLPHLVARQLGHSVTTLLKDYARIFEDFDPSERIDAEAAVRKAREAVNP